LAGLNYKFGCRFDHPFDQDGIVEFFVRQMQFILIKLIITKIKSK